MEVAAMLPRVWDITFTVSDLDRAVRFYRDVLGLRAKYQFETYVGLDCGGVKIGLAPGRQGHASPEAPCVDLMVEDVDAAYRRLREHDVTFLKEPQDTPWGGRIAQFADPDGHILQLVQINWPAYITACVPP
jgi:catechol 2,3-dioxygenase-like lactoylglutathione lyase family enzyme